MLVPFYRLAMLAPNRQRSFRTAAAAHVVFCGLVVSAALRAAAPVPVIGQMLLIAGIVEGAVLVGWRLTQLPTSQSLEFLLVSPVQPRPVICAAAMTGLTRLALIHLAGLPVVGVLVLFGMVTFADLPVLTLVPLTWGAITGVGLTTWAYESRAVRRWGEMVALAGIVAYLLVGVLAGEKLGLWLTRLPEGLHYWFMELFRAAHTYNPFAVIQYWLEPHRQADVAWERMLGLEVAA